MIKAEEQAFLRVALRKRLFSREDLEEAIRIKRKRQSKDSLTKILIRMEVLDVKAARKLQADLQVRQPQRKKVAKVKQTTQIGPYRIEKFLGAGAMGSVYVGVHSELKRQVALKVLLAEQPTQRAIDRFKREARLTARLSHPNIVRVHDAGEGGGKHYIAMDLIEGQSLDEALTLGEVDIDRAAYLVQKIAEALSYAHGQGVIHRDMKPSNVLLSKDGEPKVTDFGLAVLSERDSIRLTKTGAAVGTPAYMAPEQVLGDADRVGPHTDVYGIGATFYEILTGRPPFRGNTFLELANNICQREPEPVTEFNLEVPEELEIICLKALEKDLDLRYKNAEEMAGDLKNFLHKEPITAKRPTVIQNVKKWTRRHKGITYGVIIGLMSLALLTAFYLRLPGHLVLNTIPKGAVVVIDGEEFRTPFEDDNFPPGTYGIKFKHPGYKEEIPGVSELYVARNATTQVTYNLFSTRGTLVLRSQPPGAKVSIYREGQKDVFRTGTTAFVEELPAGTYRLELSLSGHETKVFPEVKVEEGNQMTRLPLVKLIPDEGFLTLRSDPGDVSISLESKGFAPKTLLGPFTKQRVGSGTYRIFARKSGYLPREAEVEIKQGQEQGCRVSLPSLASARMSLPGKILGKVLPVDLNGDSERDIVVLTRSGPDRSPELSVYRRASEGSLAWRRDTPARRLIGIIQVDRDRHLDIIAGGRDSIECYHGGNGYRLWKAQVPGRWATFTDRGTESQSKIYAVDKSNHLVEIHALSGRVKKLSSLPGRPTVAPVVSKRLGKSVYMGVRESFGDQYLFMILGPEGKSRFEWKSKSRILAIRELSVRGGIDNAVAVLTAQGPVMVFSVSTRQNLLSLGSEDSRFSSLEVGAISGTGLDDIVVAERGQIKVFSGTSGRLLWTRDGRYGLPFESKTRSEPGRLWIDGRLFDGVEGKQWRGAAAGPWMDERRYPGPVVDLDGDGSEDVLAVGADSRSLVVLRTNESPLLFNSETSNASAVSLRGQSRVSAVLEGRNAVVYLGADGRILWRKQLGTRLHALTLVGDVDGDQLPELVVAGESRLYCLSGKLGSTLWSQRKTAGALRGVERDYDGDRIPDFITANPSMIVSSSQGKILNEMIRLDEPVGELKPRGHPKPVGFAGGGMLSFERDKGSDSGKGILLCYDGNGSRRWRRAVSARELQTFPASSRGEVSRCIIRSRTRLSVLRLRDGEKIWSEPFTVDLVGMCLSRSRAKGEVRIVAVDRRGRVTCRDGNGQRMWARVLPRGPGLYSQPVVFAGVKRDAVAIAGASNDLFLMDVETGLTVWSRSLVETGRQGHHLYATLWGSQKKSTLVIASSDGTMLALQPSLPSRAPVFGKTQKLYQKVNAQRRASRKDLNQIEEEMRELILSNSNWVAARLELARLLLRLNKAEDAKKIGLSAIQQIRNEGPSRGDRGVSIDAIFVISDALVTLNDFSGAMDQVNKLRAINLVASANLAIRLGNRALELKKLKEARRFFDVAVSSQPFAAEARRGRAISTVHLKPIDDHLGKIRADLKMALVELDRDLELRAVAILIAILRKDYAEARELTEVPGDLLEEAPENLRNAYISICKGVKAIENDKGLARSELYKAFVSYGIKRGWGVLITTIRARISD